MLPGWQYIFPSNLYILFSIDASLSEAAHFIDTKYILCPFFFQKPTQFSRVLITYLLHALVKIYFQVLIEMWRLNNPTLIRVDDVTEPYKSEELTKEHVLDFRLSKSK